MLVAAALVCPGGGVLVCGGDAHPVGCRCLSAHNEPDRGRARGRLSLSVSPMSMALQPRQPGRGKSQTTPSRFTAYDEAALMLNTKFAVNT